MRNQNILKVSSGDQLDFEATVVDKKWNHGFKFMLTQSQAEPSVMMAVTSWSRSLHCWVTVVVHTMLNAAGDTTYTVDHGFAICCCQHTDPSAREKIQSTWWNLSIMKLNFNVLPSETDKYDVVCHLQYNIIITSNKNVNMWITNRSRKLHNVTFICQEIDPKTRL